MDAVEKILRNVGPCLSTELAQHLVAMEGLKPEAARKRIARTIPGVKKLAYLPFPRNARFVYLQEQYGAPWFWDALEEALLATSPAYGGAIAALRQRGDLMPKPHFTIACGSPLAQKRHLAPQTVLDRLTKAKLLEEIDVPGIGPCVARAQKHGYYSDLIPRLQARLVVEDIMLKAVRGWARSLGLVSYDKVKIRDEGSELPKVGTFGWDLSAPSYLGGLVERDSSGTPKPGFLVCDIVLDHKVTAAGIAPFLQKCKTLRHLKNVGRCLQLFVAEKYSSEAFQLAKTQGIMPGSPATLLGEEVAESLVQLSKVLRQAAGVHDVKLFDQLFNGLNRIEGAAANLRGALFEFWAAEVVRQSFSAHIRMNRMFVDGADKAEVDVQATVASREVQFYECKGYQPGGLVPDDEVERWLERRIPLVYKQALANPEWKGRTFRFEWWSTGRLSSEAIAKIEKAKATIRPTRYTINYVDAEGLTALAKDTNDRALIDALRQHFLDHPMAQIARAEAKRLRLLDAALHEVDAPREVR
ncbi:MAG: hypothetical protein ACK57J_10525 [Rubrivivax sp.]